MRKPSETAHLRCLGRQSAKAAHTSVSEASVPKATSRAVHWPRCAGARPRRCVRAGTPAGIPNKVAATAVQCGSVSTVQVAAVPLGIHLSVPSPRRRARRHARRSLLRWPTRKRVRALCQATSPLRTRNRDARIGATCTHARRSSAPIVRSPRRPAPRLLFHGTLSVRIGAHAGHARTTTALAAVLRRAVSIRRTRHRHADRRCPHRRQSCPQTCRRACHPAAKTGARLLLPAGIASAKRILGRRRRRVPSAPNAALARVPQTRSHQRRYAGHGRPSPHLRHCLGHRHPHRSHQS